MESVRPALTVFVVSDATGGTAERMARSALAQFADAPVRFVRRTQVRTPQQVRAALQEAAGQNSVVFHTLVSEDLRRLMLDEARLHGVDCLDMMGPLLDRLSRRLGLVPQEKPGLFRQLEEAKEREIEAVAFAFHHDDGQNTGDLQRAEIVLVGVSRTMKTPTMLYLAYRGWFAANVPLVPGVPLPAPLLAVPRQRVFCLALTPERLRQLRCTRAVKEGIPLEPYASPEQVQRELAFAEDLCRTYRWRPIDVTGKSVEEVAREITLLLSGSRP